jgi:hypothetical protein
MKFIQDALGEDRDWESIASGGTLSFEHRAPNKAELSEWLERQIARARRLAAKAGRDDNLKGAENWARYAAKCRALLGYVQAGG